VWQISDGGHAGTETPGGHVSIAAIA
jgi:hypothetical protein